MVYGAQTWAMTKGQEKKLQVVQRSMERVILGVSKRDRIKNNYIREKTGAKDIIYTIKNLRLSVYCAVILAKLALRFRNMDAIQIANKVL